MTETTDITVMVDRGGSVDNRMSADRGARLNHGTRMNLGCRIKHGPRRDPRRRMNKSSKPITSLLKLTNNRLAMALFTAGPDRTETGSEFNRSRRVTFKQVFIAQQGQSDSLSEWFICLAVGNRHDRSAGRQQRVSNHSPMSPETDHDDRQQICFRHGHSFEVGWVASAPER